AIVDPRNVLIGGHEALNMLVGELDLLHLLRRGCAGSKHSESQKSREQHTQKAPTRGHHIRVSNERHGMVLHLGREGPSVQMGASVAHTCAIVACIMA